MPLRNWYNQNISTRPWWSGGNEKSNWTRVIKPVPHNLVRRIRFWRIRSSEQDFKYLYWTISKILFWNVSTCKGTYMIDWVGRIGALACGFQTKKKKIARQVNRDSIGWFYCYWCSTLIKYNKSFCTGLFMMKLNGSTFFFRFVFIFNYLHVNYFSFLDLLWLGTHPFWWKEFFSRLKPFS